MKLIKIWEIDKNYSSKINRGVVIWKEKKEKN